MKRNLLLQSSSQSRNCATTFYFAQQRSSQIPILCSTFSVIDKLTVNFLDGSLSFKSKTSSSQHLRVRRPSFSSNLSQPSPLTPPVPPSTPTFSTSISFTSPRMILGTTTSSSISTLRSLVTTFHVMNVSYSLSGPHYLLIGDILYRRGVDTILHRCLTIDEVDRVLNDCHSGACGGHISSISTAQKIIRAGYFWPTLFHDCIHAMK
jgi:hypothetical protein